MKQAIKRLAAAVNDVLNENAIANEMDALFDAGEWSQQPPDFSTLVTRLGLTRKRLTEYIEQAKNLARIHDQHRPESKRCQHTGLYIPNEWEERVEAINCIFMSGELQTDSQ